MSSRGKRVYVCEVSARSTYTVRVVASSDTEAKRKAREFDACWDRNDDAVFDWGNRHAERVHSVRVANNDEQ
ncbi:MAG: hypothetical protein KGL39_38595 [Patescibacteria group bacterium]|nr:hypothetical protein [Patescibacteria group bacterium]